ncbi:hypothetical protein ACFYZ9_02385 [Streptomyces sp. NPDC001691]|uniref:hypothetical protein n=1 Tax=unclassified Streptomyces TaxID=2593676 RepID=UPI000DE89B4C|nr:hypothetical protein [Streptomyces sp. SDr-06]RCH65335.1 hypothetical protein DT019_28065 [Streptomyces sp. SDr-06]
MSEQHHDQEAGAPAPQGTAEALRAGHAARARSAASRAAAVLRHIEAPDAETPDESQRAEILFKTTHAARIAAQALAVLSEGTPNPAADSRCARNCAAAASQAAQMGRLHDGDTELSAAAFQAAVTAAQAAGAASAAAALGANETLNSQADTAEKTAVTAAEAAGWMRPGEQIPQVPTGTRSGDVMAMMHF